MLLEQLLFRVLRSHLLTHSSFVLPLSLFYFSVSCLFLWLLFAISKFLRSSSFFHFLFIASWLMYFPVSYITFLPSAPSLDVSSLTALFFHHLLNVTLYLHYVFMLFHPLSLGLTLLCFIKCSCSNIVKYLLVSISQMQLMSSLNLILLFAP